MLRGERADVKVFFLMTLVNKSVVKHNMLKRVALIMLIIALKFDVSTSCNEKIKINKMNKNCIVCVYTVSLSQLRNH